MNGLKAALLELKQRIEGFIPFEQAEYIHSLIDAVEQAAIEDKKEPHTSRQSVGMYVPLDKGFLAQLVFPLDMAATEAKKLCAILCLSLIPKPVVKQEPEASPLRDKIKQVRSYGPAPGCVYDSTPHQLADLAEIEEMKARCFLSALQRLVRACDDTATEQERADALEEANSALMYPRPRHT